MSIKDLQRLVNCLDYDAAVVPGDRFNLSDRQIEVAQRCEAIVVYNTTQISLSDKALRFLVKLGLNALIEKTVNHDRYGAYSNYLEWVFEDLEENCSVEAGLAVGLLSGDFDETVSV